MSIEQNKAIVRAFVEEAQGKGNLAVIDQYLAPDFVDHSALPGIPPSREGVRILFAALRAAFPDLQVNIRQQVAEGEQVMTHKTFTATHRGEFLGVPATGRNVSFDVIDILRVVDGRLTEHTMVFDQFGLLKQLGAIPS